MNKELELALAYWRTMAPQPKAIVYCNAIEAGLKGIETKEMVVDHELENAIRRGASIARAKNLNVLSTKVEETAEADERKTEGGEALKVKRGPKPKGRTS
jgi:hypothetical protein